MKTTQYRFGDICKLRNGYAFKSENFSTEGVPVIRISDIYDDKASPKESLKTKESTVFEKFVVKKGDILIAMSGATTGKFGKYDSDEKAYQNQRVGCFVIIDKEKLSNDYLYLLLKGLKRKIEKDAYGGGQPNISSTIIENYKIQLPSPSDQLRISTILNKADALIKLREGSMDMLEMFAKMKFLEMFFIGNNNPLVTTIESLAKKEKGSIRTGPFGSDLLHSEFNETGDVKVLGIDNVVNNVFEDGNSRYISLEKFEKLKRYKVYPKDVLISIMGTTGRTAVVPDNIPLCINTKHLAAISLDPRKANPYFLAYALRYNPYIIRQIKDKTRGAIMDGLNLGIIKGLKIDKPPIRLQNQFSLIVQKIENIKTHFRDSLHEFESLYGALSNKAFNGELSVNEKAINENIQIEPVTTNENTVIQQINKEVEEFHYSQQHKGASNEIDNEIRQLETDLQIRGEIPFLENYVKYKMVKQLFKEPFSFEQLWQEITKFPFETTPDYDKVATMIFNWLEGDNSFLKQRFNEKRRKIELLVNETITA